MRKATQDIELNGYVVPKGWIVHLFIREPNYDPFHYPEPFSFNPWRWKENRSLESHYYCMLFGRGILLCAGKELGMAEISLLTDYVGTKSYLVESLGDLLILHQFRLYLSTGFGSSSFLETRRMRSRRRR